VNASDAAVLAARWAARAHHELETSFAFVEVARALAETGAPAEDVAVARQAIEDERLHARLCSDLAATFAGSRLPDPAAGAVPRASFAGCDTREASVLYVVMQCALGEGVAAGYLGRCLDAAESEPVRAALRTMLADEVRHARLGYRYLAGLDERDRMLVARALPRLAETVLDFWLDLRDYPRALPSGYGCLAAAELVEAVREGWQELVMPGFEHVGIPVAETRAAVARRGYFGRLKTPPVPSIK
jgi:hypothetical protein